MAGKGKIDNLIKAEDLTSDELRNRARKGGKASGKARRDKREQRDVILDIMSLPLEEGDVENIQALAQAKGKNISVNTAIVLGQVKKAVKGDTKAAEYLRDTAGWKPTESVKVEAVNVDESVKNVQAYMKGKKQNG